MWEATTASALFERDRELDAIRTRIEAAQAGVGGMLLVQGPAGIGKTRLIEAGAEIAGEHDLTLLTARGGELEREIAFGVVRQLFEREVAAAEPGEREQLLAGAAGLAAPVLDLVARPETAGDSGARALHGLYWLAANLATRRPVVVLIDDVHWCDAASLRFLLYLGRRADELALLIIAARRPAEASMAGELQAAIEREATAVLEPAPLTLAATASLVRAELSSEPDPPLVEALHEATKGNPYLLREAIAAVRAEELPLDASSAHRIGEVVPAGISRQIVLRLGRLQEEARALARAVAVLGTDAELRHAAELARLEPDEAAVAADALAAAAILAPGSPLEFVHPLVRSAVYANIPAGERALAHRSAARILAADRAEPTLLAVHWLAVPPAGDHEAVTTLRAAAARALERGTPASAAAYLRRALAEPPREAERGALLAELGRAELQAADPERGTKHLEEAMALSGDPLGRARIAHDLAMGLIAPGRYADAVSMLERATEEAGRVDPELAVGLEGELVVAALMEHRTDAVRKQHAARLERGADPSTPGGRAALAALALERLLSPGPVSEGVDLARSAWEAGLLDERGGFSGLAINCVHAAVMGDAVELAERMSDEALADARRRGSVIGIARQACFRAILSLRVGRLADAESFARQSVDLASEPGYRVAGMARAPLVEALVARGRLDSADEALADVGFDREISDSFMLNFVLHSRATLRLAQRRTADAIIDLEEFARREANWRRDNPALFAWRSLLAEATLALGEVERASELARAELELARRCDSVRAIGVALRTLGLSAQGGEGLRRLEESVKVLADTPARLEHARSLVELGAALRRSGERSAARDPLHSGMELAHRCGAMPLVERAREELTATGARPRRIMRSGVDALTPSELRVARMAAEGMANREIAQALFVTLRTVEVHLTHTYQKLDISSREELSAALTAGIAADV